eukprot:TRINITY_DN79168_c0_g1_i1.p1 TRINITY_DN79168_c0_g1~~TRINITY_DN79168_c0_g1_i1.p1  ORF type:complete len:674 (+),score=112.11 TRINITY_DN79168_c0_g1_i1:32-2023(+)
MPRPGVPTVRADCDHALALDIDDHFQMHLQGLVTAFRDLQRIAGRIQSGVQVAQDTVAEAKGSEVSGFRISQSMMATPAADDQPTETKRKTAVLDDDLSGRRDQLLNLFKELDSDGSGVIGIEEMREALRAIGEHPARARRLLEAADINGDGEIELEEWNQVVDSLLKGTASSAMAQFASRLMHHTSENGTIAFAAQSGQAARPLDVPWLMLRYDSMLRMMWELFIASLLLYLAVLMPFNLAFYDDMDQRPFLAVGTAVDTAFLLDILVNFRTTYVNRDGTEVIGSKAVAMHYIKTWFVLDLCSSIPLENMSAGLVPSFEGLKIIKGTKIFKVLKMLRALKLVGFIQTSQLGNQLEEYITNNNLQSSSDMAQVLFCCCFLCHLLACFMCITGSGFLDNYLGSSASISSMYCSALYWAVMTVTTVGYGDIIPISDEERVYSMLAMMVGGTFYGYVVGTLSVVVAHRDLHKQAYRERMRNLAAWLGHHKFPQSLRRRIWIYFRSYEHNKTGLEKNTILDDLSPELCQAVADFLVHAEVRNNLLFQNLPESVMVRLLPILQKITAQTGEQITSAGEIGHAMFIIIGGFAIMERESEKRADGETAPITLKTSDSFGEEIILGMQNTYEYTVTAASLCELFMIRTELFMHHFIDLPQVREQMLRNFQE